MISLFLPPYGPYSYVTLGVSWVVFPSPAVELEGAEAVGMWKETLHSRVQIFCGRNDRNEKLRVGTLYTHTHAHKHAHTG